MGSCPGLLVPYPGLLLPCRGLAAALSDSERQGFALLSFPSEKTKNVFEKTGGEYVHRWIAW